MSSNIRITRICSYCKQDFEARKTTSKTCSDKCAKMYYKQRQKEAKIIASNLETAVTKAKPVEDLKLKEFLTVKDVAKLLNCSIRTAYNIVGENGSIKSINLAKRKTLIARSEIDKLFI
jgi:excisionase family DNA binding protein